MAEAPNPLNATYWATLGALDFQRTNTLGEDIKERAGAEASYKYNRGELQRAEPLRLKAGMNKANTEGLLQSGILANRQGQTQTEYVGKEGRLAEQRKAAIDRANQKDVTAQGTYNVGQALAAAKAGEDYKRELLEYPPAAEPAAAAATTYPANAAQAGGKPGPGGVIPYETGNVRVGPGTGIVSRTSAGGHVRVKAPPPNVLTVAQARKAAIRKQRPG